MTLLPQTFDEPALIAAARQVVWWMPPEETLRDEILFLNQAMQFGTLEVVQAIRKHFDDETLRNSLRNARPGIFDRRSWAYWHGVLGVGTPHHCRSAAFPASARPTSKRECGPTTTNAKDQ